jgi:prevent-host-death family protein
METIKPDAGGNTRDVYPYPTVPMIKARAHLTPIVRAADEEGSATVLTSYGRPVVAVVPIGALAELGWISGGGPVTAQPVTRNGHLEGYFVPALRDSSRSPDLEALDALMDGLEHDRAGWASGDD